MIDQAGISLEVPFEKKISRLFIFRGLWVFVAMWPMFALMFWVELVMFFHFFYMLFLGKRHEGSWGVMKRFFVWMLQWNAYFMALVNKRPNFWY